MRAPKFQPGEAAEVYCWHRRDGAWQQGWLAGQVVQADHRMAAVRLEADVATAAGWLVPDRTLWCAHGSPHLRRPDAAARGARQAA